MAEGSRSSAVVRTGVVIVAVGVTIALTRFFRAILTPLIVATFLLLLIEALAQWVQRLSPRAPAWVRHALAGGIILAAFLAVAAAMALQAPAFAGRIQALGPRINDLIVIYGAQVGLKATSLDQVLRGVSVWGVLGAIFSTARGVASYVVLVVIYLGFLIASRATFGRKLDGLYDSEAHRQSAHRVIASVRTAVQTYVKLQTVKATITAAAAFAVLAAVGVHDAVFIAFAVFLAVFVPIIGPAFGVVMPTLIALAQFGALGPPLIVFAVLEITVFVNGNVIMPRLTSDSLNVDPLLVLMSLGFWGLILGAPGVVLSTPLTVTVMAIAGEFEGTRWLAVLLSKDGQPRTPAPA